MKFLSLKIRNFLTIGDADPISLDNRGLCLIQGMNEDDTSATSNGVGKSSIPDALCWALYGATARGESGDAVVNNTVKKNTLVQVVMQDGATTYRISRYRKDAEFKNQTFIHAASGDGELWVDMSKGTESETQEVINQVMGCSLDVFMAAIYAGQEEMPDLPKMTDKQLKLLIEEAAGVERLEQAYAVARDELGRAKVLMESHLTKRNLSKEHLAATQAKIAKARMEFDEFESGRKARHESYLSASQTTKLLMTKLLAELKARDALALTTEGAVIDAQLATHDDQSKARLKAQSLLNDKQRRLSRQQDAIKLATDVAATLKYRLDNAAAEVMKPCPACGKPGGEEHDVETFRAHIKGELTKQLQAIQALKKELTEVYLPEVADAQAQFDSIVLPDVSAIAARRSAINVELGKIETIKNHLRLSKKDYDTSNEQAARALTDPNPLEAVITMLKTNETEYEHGLGVLETSIAESETKLEIANSVVKVFGPAGVRAHILDTVTPFLNERTADYLSVLSDGNISAVWSTLSTTAKGDLKEKFNIDVTNEKGAKTFKGLSGGEKRKVRLAAMLALQDLVASRATKPIELWIGDEIDDALDSAGLERLMGVLERKARERGTVLVISHNDLKCWIDNTVTVTKRDGLSAISGYLCE